MAATGDYITLHDVLKLVIAAFRSSNPEHAEKALVRWLGDDRVWWKSLHFSGKSDSALVKMYTNGDPRFWLSDLEINWEENWARERSPQGAFAYQIWVSRKDLLALLRLEPSEQETPIHQADIEALTAVQTAPLRTPQVKTIKGWQAIRVLRLLPKLYPPDGKVSDETSTTAVEQAVKDELEKEARAEGQLKDKNSKLPNPPSWDVVNKVLGRDKRSRTR